MVDPRNPEAAALDEAAAIIRAGGLIAMPTDTLYGLGADPFSVKAVARVFGVKGRAPGRALPLVAADFRQVIDRLGALSPSAERLASIYWPGPLTLLVRRPADLPSEVAGGTDRVGVRVPAHEVTRALCRASARPLTATSANLTGEPASADPDHVARTIGSRVDLLLDAGPTVGGLPSTIVDASGPELRLVRAGAIPWEELRACVSRG